jgi:hypothetical protein
MFIFAANNNEYSSDVLPMTQLRSPESITVWEPTMEQKGDSFLATVSLMEQLQVNVHSVTVHVNFGPLRSA